MQLACLQQEQLHNIHYKRQCVSAAVATAAYLLPSQHAAQAQASAVVNHRFPTQAVCTVPSLHACGQLQLLPPCPAGDTAWRYPLESHLHELLLQSPHRTLNPEEADYFYVPVYASCFMEAVAGWADTPWWGVQRYAQYNKTAAGTG